MRQEQEAIPHHSTTSDLDVNVLLTQFGQAMARVGQLEQLCRTQEQKIAELESKVQAAQATNKPDSSAQLTPDFEARLRRKDETIDALRVQLMTAQSELARSREKLKLAAEGAYMRHRHSHHKWWQLWKK